MQHIVFADKSLLVGDDAAETLIKYAAVIGQKQTADTVKLSAIDGHGASVEVTFLLDTGTNLVIETTDSELPEPDNAEAVRIMQERIMRLSSPPQVQPADETMPANYEDLHLE